MSKELISLPADTKPWPEGLPEPVPHGEAIAAKKRKEGHYCSRWPGGGIRVFGIIEAEFLVEWIYIEESQDAGYARSDRSPWCAQRYFANGTVEEFNMWDDVSKPYEAGMTFEEWLEEQSGLMRNWKPRDLRKRIIDWIFDRLTPPYKGPGH